jgi:hypothetical protein
MTPLLSPFDADAAAAAASRCRRHADTLFCRQPLFAAAVAIARLFSSQTPIAGAISIPIRRR